MGILDVIAKETNGIRQYSDQYQIRSNGSHTVHTVQERPFTPDNCPPLADHDNYTLDALLGYANLHSNREMPTLKLFVKFAYNRFSPREIFAFLFWYKQYHDDDEVLMITQLIRNEMLEDDDE